LRSREPELEARQKFDDDQTYRYAAASGDPMPIHLDDALAKSVGLPGIIIHGMCTMAFTSVAVIEHCCPDEPTRLERLAVRFARTVQPGQTITTRLWGADGDVSGADRDISGANGVTYAYETESDEGAIVIKDGLAQVAMGS
jgi:acyl dehydratase